MGYIMENRENDYLSQVQILHEAMPLGDTPYEYVYAMDGNVEVSTLEYFWDEGMQVWSLSDLNTDEEFRGRGLAGRIFQEFVKRVGVNQPIYVGCIVHEPSIPPLRQFYEESRNGNVTVPAEILEGIPMVQFMRANGIQIDEVVVSYNPDREEQGGTDDINYNISFSGRT